MTASHGWQHTLTDFLHTPVTHAQIYVSFFKEYRSCVSHTYYPHMHRAHLSQWNSLWSSYAQVISLTHTHTHRRTHAQTPSHLPNPSFPRLISSLLSPLKMTVADISTHSEGKRADISSWVTKLGSNYIALSRQPWLLLTRADIWSVSAGYQFYSLPPIQHWADSLCYVFWMHSWPIRYYFTGRMFSLNRY